MKLLESQLHTVLVLIAFVATLVAYVVDPGDTLSNLLLPLGGGVAGAAGQAAVKSSSTP